MFSDKPSSDTLEISLFGPGVGECIVVHVGNNEWVIVDSWIDRDSDLPIAEKYLHTIGCKTHECVKLLVVTHWHDDHIRGMAHLMRETNAKMCYSAAYERSEFTTLFNAYAVAAPRLVNETSGVQEMHEIITELMRKKQYAITVKKFMDIEKFMNGQLQFIGLSPSEATVLDTQTAMIESLLTELSKRGGRRVPRPNRNDLSVVMKIAHPHGSFLLGGDLEETKHPNKGWNDIVELYKQRPYERKSNLFKVPHHGSVTGHNDEVWSHVLEHKPICIVAPYSAGRKALPSDEDITRIKGYAQKLFCTFPPRGIKFIPRGPEARTSAATAKHRYVLGNRNGQIRVRINLSDPNAVMDVKCSGSAKEY